MTSALLSIAAEKTEEIRAVCLDVDDTLVDYARSARSALAELLGHDDAWPIWQRITDEHLSRVIAGEVDYHRMRNERTRAFFANLGEDLDDVQVAALEQRRQMAMERGWRLFPDALPLLHWLRSANLRVAAVTNASGPHQRAKLAGLGVLDFFDHVVIAGELGAAKPDPVIFHTACVAMGVSPAQTLHVGDRLDQDAVGARDAGMHGVWLNRDPGAQPAAPEGVWVVNTLAELPELLVSAVPSPRR
ncbi:HAD family hydrolase [Gandjariella thermophila]|uniref:Haloacid dehalogenase n=1 Tax=Gandjariella thermophila TaxID=1931992 RepID=A0A4D4J753_9PSEU|nr:HAD family hydrolase [Gandjariella thermophila]GDY32615.1 haloacid dehalogenase [Gandjariella thermophila]